MDLDGFDEEGNAIVRVGRHTFLVPLAACQLARGPDGRADERRLATPEVRCRDAGCDLTLQALIPLDGDLAAQRIHVRRRAHQAKRGPRATAAEIRAAEAAVRAEVEGRGGTWREAPASPTAEEGLRGGPPPGRGGG